MVETEPAAPPPRGQRRGRVDHVVILDGTLSTLDPGMETNAGLAFRLIAEGPLRPDRTVYYEPGMQWQGWRRLSDLAQGRGLNRQIKRAYGYLASHYRAGDRIFLLGYSRGAFAVRSLAGVIDQVGLLRADAATERNVQLVYRHYRLNPEGEAARAFARLYCHPQAPIQMVGVWDTVKALGLRLPLLWKLTEKAHAFHSHHLGASVRHGFHALALNETRAAFAPVLWDCPPGWDGNVEQVWFRGAHGDIGGQIGTFPTARPLSNIPLVWMLDRAEACGLTLPPDWRARFPCDPEAPMVGTWKSWGKLFLLRHRRDIGRDRSERLHDTVVGSARDLWPPAALPAE
ncbi:DUF2235 domain-containing protein [Rhodobacter sp. Har01]|uniref:DUF2235 domain-containing protein n=1 Tax=Rhodobacter sp. Har01 TaxID=2883999 RepID=UPI001D06A957|nr:DUF2235 domain-containing protein [Rhodobacter sp. Har01]MCB6176528.1 DUF2235 domain-containing protein [Rhodobacter sp. Har01]